MRAVFISNPADIAPGAVCFVSIGTGSRGHELARLRAMHQDTVYLVALTVQEADAALQADLFGAGADDILCEMDPRQLVSCLLRARRHLQLRQREERWRQDMQAKLDIWQHGLDQLPTPIYVKDVEGRYLVCNAAFGNFLGLSSDRVLGQRLQDFVPPEMAEAYHASDLQLLRQGGVMRTETDVCLPETGMRHIMVHKARLDSERGEIRGVTGVIIDITERKELESRLIEAAERDPLTNAANRRKFFQVASEQIAAAKRETILAVAVIDIDHFKSINDELGHAEGDVTLCSIVDTLRSQEAEGMLVARAGGEEFFAFFPEQAVPTAYDMLETARQDIARYCQVQTGAGAAGTISAGLAYFNPSEETIDQALRRADIALYQAKRDGRNRLYLAE
ncbi:GGDEF domain-containing protein [Rhizobium sp. AG855]|uniref:GGDEF domain-containing protein n=1 Tax=Rhizobium sp. AG855 TaxID=2183898 RepID=UPI000E72ABF8|nr:GGDEF domain-containing protein [Rhizobium sp. AG855]